MLTLTESRTVVSLMQLNFNCCRKSLENHEAFRMHYGGRPFTQPAIQQNLKVPDGQQWIACHLLLIDVSLFAFCFIASLLDL